MNNTVENDFFGPLDICTVNHHPLVGLCLTTLPFARQHPCYGDIVLLNS